MSDKPKLDSDKIARALHAERRGAVRAGSGWFGAAQLVADPLPEGASSVHNP